MAIELEDVREFEASSARLYACLTDAEFQAARSRALGTGDVSCERRDEQGAAVLLLRQSRPTGFGTEPFESRHETRWDATHRRAEWTLTQTGGPGRAHASGTLTIEPRGPERGRLVLRGELTIEVPRLLRPVVERAVALGFRLERRKQGAFTERWLSTARAGE